MSDVIGTTAAGVKAYGPVYEEGPNGQRMMTIIYTGTEAECLAQRIIAKASGAQYINLGPKGDGNFELRASWPWGIDGQYETPVDTHELEITISTPPVYQNARLRSLLDADAIASVKTTVEGVLRGELTLAAADTVIDGFTTSGDERNRAKALFALVCNKGTDSFIQFNQVYRRTLTVTNPSQLKAAYEGVNKIWTRDEVMAWEGLTNAWYFVLDTGTLWHKARPSVTTASRGKTQISYYYTITDYASSLLYDHQGAATESGYYWT